MIIGSAARIPGASTPPRFPARRTISSGDPVIFHPPTNNVAGIYQEFASAPNDVYQASGWFYSSSKDGGGLGAGGYAWVDVSFLDSGGNVLALYTSGDFSATVGLDGWFQYSVTNALNLASPISTGDPYFTNYSVTGTVTQMVAPGEYGDGALPV